MMRPRHLLRCLGHPVLFAPNGDPIRFRTKKHLALLVYLAVESHRIHRRDRLAELLWPRAEIAEGRHSLATGLSILRPRLGVEALEATRDHVKLNVETLALDLDRLSSKDVLASDTAGVLEVAAFLDGFEIPDAPEFAIWKDRQQSRLLPLIKEGLLILIDRCRRTGDSRQVELLADRMLVLDELSEEATRAKMEARAVVGDRLTALKVFEQWKKRLLEDLGASPSEEVEKIAARLRRGGWERIAANDGIPTIPPTHGRERAFVGRAREYAHLYELWESLEQGRHFNVMVLGDSGVGKTTLVERLTKIATLEGAAVARVQSYDLERSIPFATLGEIAIRLLECPGASATASEALSELGRTVPEVRSRFPSLPPAGDSQGETARLRLTESFHQLVSAVAEEHPLILVIDDLHLADEASLAVLHLVLRRIVSERVMAIFTSRPGELMQSSQGALLRDSIAKAGGKEITVAPLDDASTAELLDALLSQEVPRPTFTARRALVRASGGFPMVLELLVHDWRNNGTGSVAFALEAMTAEFNGDAGPMGAYGRILSRLAGALDPATRNALDLAAVLGRRLNDLPMYSVVDLSMGSTMAALGQLSEMRILRDGERGLEFVNELVRAHAYAAVPSSVRKALHSSVADRLLQSGDRGSAVGLEVAWHCMRAGRTSEAIPHMLRGARDAVKGGAPQGAEAALTSALPYLQGEDLSNATILLVEAQQEQGRWRESLTTIETFKATVTEGQSQELFALAALARKYVATPMDEWLECLPPLKQIMEACPHISSRIRAARAVAHATSLLRDRAFARAMLEVVDRIPMSNLDDEARGNLGLARALLLFQGGDMDACYEYASSLLEDLRSRGLASSTVIQLQEGLGAARGRQGRYAESAWHHERALGLAALLGNEHLSASISANLAFCYGRLGRYDDQLACALRCQAPGPEDGVSFVDMQLAIAIAFANATQGNIRRMRHAFDGCERRFAPHTERLTTQSWLLWKSDVLAVAGLPDEALRSAQRAVHGYEMRLECSALAGVFARWTALTCGSSNLEEARDLLDHLDTNLHDYDALDQVEILCAKVYCGRGNVEQLAERIQARLRSLPDSALLPLRASGIQLRLPAPSTSLRTAN